MEIVFFNSLLHNSVNFMYVPFVSYHETTTYDFPADYVEHALEITFISK